MHDSRLTTDERTDASGPTAAAGTARSRRRRATDRLRDDRGVSEVLGAMLMFGLVLAMVVLIQVAAVPALNQQIEFSHNQRAQGDIQALADHVDYTAATGAETSTTLEMGVFYPTRIFLLNPPPASATLSTEPTSMTLENVSTDDDETADYWNGQARTFDSVRLTYSPDYNEYTSAPTTVYEGWSLYNEHPQVGTDTTLDDTSPVNGKRIRLVALDGSRSETSVSPVTFTAEPVSVPEQTVTVRNDTDPIVLQLDTQLSQEQWDKILEDETCNAGADYICNSGPGHVVDATVSNGHVRIVLEPGVTYELRMSKVGVGSQVTEESPRYVTAIDAPSVIQPGGTDLTVEVRDKFNTAKSGVEVTFTTNSPGVSLTPQQTRTDEDGQATVRVVPAANTGSVTVTASVEFNGIPGTQPAEKVVLSGLTVSDQQPNDPSEINPNDGDSVVLSRALLGPSKSHSDYVDATWQNLAGSDRTIDAMRLNFYYDNEISQGGGETVTYFTVDGSALLSIRGGYNSTVPSNPTIQDGADRTYRFQFYDENGNLIGPEQGDFFIVTFVYDDGTTSRYFLDPRNP